MDINKFAIKSLRGKFFAIMTISSMTVLLVGFLGYFAINSLHTISQQITKNEVQRMEVTQDALVLLMKGTQGVNELFEVNSTQSLQTIQVKEATFRNTSSKFSVLIKALSHGSESTAFRQSWAGLGEKSWIDFYKNQTPPKFAPPTVPEKQSAQLVNLYFGAYVRHAEDSILSFKRFHRLSNEGQTVEAQKAFDEGLHHHGSAHRYFELTLESLEQLMEISTLEIGHALNQISDVRETIFIVLFSMTLFGFFFAFVFSNYFTSEVLFKPLNRILATVNTLARGALSQRISVHTQDELGELSKAINTMAQALETSHSVLEAKIEERTKDIHLEKKKLETTLDSIGDGAFVIDRAGMIKFFNTQAEELTGFRQEEAIFKPYKEIVQFVQESTGDPNYKSIELALNQGIIGHMANHNLLINKKGGKMPIANSAAPIKTPNGAIEGCIVVFRDMTQEYRLDRMKSEFISVASHQLRTPLTAIRWFSELLLEEDLGKINDKQREVINDTERSVIRMTKLVNGLLDISRIESNIIKVDPQPIVQKTFLEDIVQDLMPLAIEKQINLHLNEVADLETISTDSQLLYEITSNLLTNALKYSPPAGEVYISSSLTKENLVISVVDHGYGIPKKQQAQLFEKFFRGDNISTVETDGTGLGLYIVKQVVNLLGGRIWFDSIENEGTTFSFSIPLSGSPKIDGKTTLNSNIQPAHE